MDTEKMSGLEIFIKMLQAKEKNDYPLFEILARKLTIDQIKEIRDICYLTNEFTSYSLEAERKLQNFLEGLK